VEAFAVEVVSQAALVSGHGDAVFGADVGAGVRFVKEVEAGISAESAPSGSAAAGEGDDVVGDCVFNEVGQIAFKFSLDDGRQCLAIWTVPKPTSLALQGLGGLLLLRRRPSHPAAT
jgi:hypothetical protein